MRNIYTPHIDIPTPEVHARFFNSKLTKNTLDDIVSAHTELVNVLTEYHQLHDQMCKLHEYKFTHLFEIWQDTGTELTAEMIRELNDYNLTNTPEANFDNYTSREKWPIKSWIKATKEYKKINQQFRERLGK